MIPASNIKHYIVTFENSSRIDNILASLKKQNIQYEQVNGISRYHHPVLKQVEHITPFPNEPINTGITACFLSHALAIEKAYQSNEEYFMIIEDDAVFIENYFDQLQKRIDNLPDDWEICMLCAYIQTWNNVTFTGKVSSLNNLFQTSQMLFGAQGYLVRRSTAEKMLQWAHTWVKDFQNPTLEELSVCYMKTSENFIHQSPNNKIYITYPLLIVESSFNTFLQSNNQLMHHRRYYGEFMKMNRYY